MTDQEKPSLDEIVENTLLMFAVAVLEPCELPGENEVVQCMKTAGPNSFTDLYTKSVHRDYRVKRTHDVWKVLERSSRFEGLIHSFQRNVKYIEEIRKVDPRMFASQSQKNPKLCTLRFRKVKTEQLITDFLEIDTAFQSLVAFDNSKSVRRLATNVFDYLEKARCVWAFTYFSIQNKHISKRRQLIENQHKLRGRREDRVPQAITMKENKKAKPKEYGLLEDDARWRVSQRILPRNYQQKPFDFGRTPDEVRESCAFLFENILHNKKRARELGEPFYKGVPCDFSASHHPRLPAFDIRSAQTARCVACTRLWPLYSALLPSRASLKSGRVPLAEVEGESPWKRLAELPTEEMEETEAEEDFQPSSHSDSQNSSAAPSYVALYGLNMPNTPDPVYVGMSNGGSLSLARLEVRTNGKEEANHDIANMSDEEMPSF